MPYPRVGDPYRYRQDPTIIAPVLGANEHEVVVDLGGEPYGFSPRTFANLFEAAT